MMGRKRTKDTNLPDRVYKKHSAYYFVDKDNKWHRLGKTYSEAIVGYAQHLKGMTNRVRMCDIFARYIKEVVPGKAPRTQKDNLIEIKNLTMAFGHMTPNAIKPKHIYAYMDARNAPTRANNEKGILSHVYSYAIRWGLVENNPCREVKKFKQIPRDRYIKDDEFWSVYNIANDVIKCAMMLAVITGLRIGDILKLSQHDIKKGYLEVNTKKTGKKLLIEITPDLKKAIGECKKLGKTLTIYAYLIRNKKGYNYTYSGFASMWQRVMRKALETGALKERFTFHDIRAKAGTDSQNKKLLGHTNEATFERIYNRKGNKVIPNKLTK